MKQSLKSGGDRRSEGCPVAGEGFSPKWPWKEAMH